MANKLDNLKKGKATQFKAGEEQAKIASEGGKKSAAARRTNADIRKMLNMALFEEYTDKHTGKKIEGIQGIVNALIVKSLNGKDKDQLAAIKYIFNLLGLDKTEADEEKDKAEIDYIRAKIAQINAGQGGSAVDDDIRRQIDDLVKDIKPIEDSDSGNSERDN